MSAPLRFDANIKWLFTELRWERRFDAAAAAGFAAVEIPEPYQYMPSQISKLLDDSGLRTVLINSPSGPENSLSRNGSACIPELVKEFRDGLLVALEYAVALGAGVVHLQGGIRPSDVSRDQAFATYVANVSWAAEQAASTNVTLALEALNHRDAPGFILRDLAQAAAVVRTIASGNLKIMFDVYHCQVTEGDVTTRLRELMPDIAHIQVADVPGRGEPGSGELNWDFLFQVIRALGYSGWIGCEYRPIGTTLRSLSWLDRYRPELQGDNRV